MLPSIAIGCTVFRQSIRNEEAPKTMGNKILAYYCLCSLTYQYKATHIYNLQTFPCFLHLLNTLIGRITAYPSMKEVARKNTRLVSFFTSSHYWGGQLLDIARKEGISRGLVMNTESRWYALVLMFLSIQQFK